MSLYNDLVTFVRGIRMRAFAPASPAAGDIYYDGSLTKIGGTAGLGVPVGTTGQRGTGVGMLRVNSTRTGLEVVLSGSTVSTVAIERSGTTGNRPTLDAADAGACYWDTTLAKLAVWNGTAWKLADGTSA
jgi:hypothetical protein